MREILFKAKRVDNGEWVEGFYVHVSKGRYEKEEHLIQPIAENGSLDTIRNVLPKTVSQFTGYDNGEKFFENDIFKDGQDNIYTIRYADYCFIADDGTCECQLDDILDSYCAIIGNLFDNPELLESEAAE